jgi:hypothetical protein
MFIYNSESFISYCMLLACRKSVTAVGMPQGSPFVLLLRAAFIKQDATHKIDLSTLHVYVNKKSASSRRIRLQLKCDGTRWRTGGEVKGNMVYPALLPLMCTLRLPVVEWTDPPPPADLNGLVRFAERRNLVFARVPSQFERSLLTSHNFSTTYYRQHI